MEINEKVKTQEQKIAKLERQLAQHKLKKRKAETRNKIQLGGLVIKAKMDQYPKDIILGALIDSFEQINKDPSVKTIFQSKGHGAFLGFEE